MVPVQDQFPSIMSKLVALYNRCKLVEAIQVNVICKNLLRDVKGLPIRHDHENIQALNCNVTKSECELNHVIASYVLVEIPSMKERITLT